MAVYDIQVDGKWVQPSSEQAWGCDVFDGRHIIPASRDLVSDNNWGPGVNSIPGPPGSSFFKLEFWIEGDGDRDLLESRIRELLGFFRQTKFRRNFDFVWRPGGGASWLNWCPMRITSMDVTYSEDRVAARAHFVCENLQGFWRESQARTHESSNFGGGSVQMNSGDAPVYDAVIEIAGPCGNPTIAITPDAGEVTRWVTYTGVIAEGQTLRINCSPIQATLNGTPVNQNLSWYGSEGRALDIAPGDWVNCKATGVNAGAGSRWRVGYRQVRY